MDTRNQIIRCNFDALRKQGFQALRPDRVLAEMGLSKGAYYHYFPDKSMLAYAIIDEVISPAFVSNWLPFEEATERHADVLRECILSQARFVTNDEAVCHGCPLTNLKQEMAALDEGFRTRLEAITDRMAAALSTGLRNGMAAGVFRPDIDPMKEAYFMIGAVEGAFSMAKVKRSRAIFLGSLDALLQYTKGFELHP